MIENILFDLGPYIRTVTTILIHSLWQGILIGLLTAIVLFLIKSDNAKIRYAVSCSAMAVAIIAVAATAIFVLSDRFAPTRQTSGVTSDQINAGNSTDTGVTTGVPASATDISSSNRWWQHPLFRQYIFMIWFAGVMMFSINHLFGWRRARGLARRGTCPAPPEWQTRFDILRDELRINRIVTFLGSSLVKVPCVIGWMKPVVLVPVSMFTSLSPSEIEMILVHELAHVQRFDVLINIVQTTRETLLFFNPAIWWISRQIRIERENCCDDKAITRTGNRLGYARALTNLEELKMIQTNFGTALAGTPLERRIRRIVGITRPRFYSSLLSISGMLLFAFMIVVVIGPLSGSHDSVAQADERVEAMQAFNPEPDDLRGEWEIETDGNDVKILVYGKESSGMNFAFKRNELAHVIDQGETSFQIVRDAGTLFLAGSMRDRGRKVVGSGEWYFQPDTAYVYFMSRHGLRENDKNKALSLAIFDVSREYLAGMEDYGLGDLNVDQLISARIFGISPEIVEEFRKVGYTDLSYNTLLSMRNQGVMPDDARRFEKAGVGHLTTDQLISARIHNITPEFIEGFRKAGFNDLSYNSFATLRAFNIDVGDFEDCYEHRFMDLSQDNMVWVCGFGFTRKDIKRMQDLGYTDIDTIIKVLSEEAGR
ncbi:MAG: M56 family metallopeptidase [Candidatus Zixiibacteriota bacterium]